MNGTAPDRVMLCVLVLAGAGIATCALDTSGTALFPPCDDCISTGGSTSSTSCGGTDCPTTSSTSAGGSGGGAGAGGSGGLAGAGGFGGTGGVAGSGGFAGGGGDITEPSDVSGLRLWLRSDRGISLNGDDVSFWADQSGNGNDIGQIQETRQPELLTSGPLPLLQFVASEEERLQSGTPIACTAYTVGIVLRYRQLPALAGSAFYNGSSGSRVSVGVVVDGSPQRALRHDGVGVVYWGAATTVPEVWLARFNGVDTAEFSVNGAYQGAQLLAPGSSPPWALTVGSRGTGEHADVDVQEVVLYSRAISTPEADALWAYFQARYGL